MKICLFDIDGVVVPESDVFFAKRLAELHNIPLPAVEAFFRHQFIHCLIGKSDIESELSLFFNSLGLTGSPHEIIQYWLSTERKTDERLLSFIDTLRQQGVSCYIVSNQFKQRAEYLMNEVGLSNHFDGAFFSSSLGYLKNNPRFFKEVLKNFSQYQPNDIVFWDNTLEYVLTAESLGINSYLYETFESFKQTMEELFSFHHHITTLVKTLFNNDEVTSLKPIHKGNVAEVYDVILKQRGSLIVELFNDASKYKLGEFQQSIAVRCREDGIPVSNVLAAGNTIIPYSYIIYQKIEGISADEYPGDKHLIFNQVGALAKKIHELTTHEYGRLWYWEDHPTLWTSWKSYVEDDLNRLKIQKNRLTLPAEDHIFLDALFERCLPIADWTFTPSIIHGDLVLKNIIVSEVGDIKSIIDWDEAIFGRAPHHELASTLLWISADEALAFFKGYGISQAEWQVIKPEVELLELLKLAEYFIYFKSIQQQSRADEMREKIKTIYQFPTS